MLSIRRSAAPGPATVSPTGPTDGWAALLEDEERHVASQGFGAGVIVVNYAPELLKRIDEQSRAMLESAILAMIDKALSWTDRAMIVAPGRLGVVTVPVEGTLALAARARILHDELHGGGLAVDVAYALRRDRGGLAAAAARADAALDTAAARRRSPLPDLG